LIVGCNIDQGTPTPSSPEGHVISEGDLKDYICKASLEEYMSECGREIPTVRHKVVCMKQNASEVAEQIVQEFHQMDLCTDTVDTPTPRSSSTRPCWPVTEVTTSRTAPVQMADPSENESENSDVEYV
jgi:hypothetical protein